MLKGIKFQDLNIIQTLDTTHEGLTKVYLAKAQIDEGTNGQKQAKQILVVCKSMQKLGFKDTKSIQHVKNQKQALLYFTSQKPHPRINQILATFQDSQHIYFLLKPAKGLPLHKLLQMLGKFSISFAKLVLAQIAMIMRDFHAQGFIYRDIKASNFLVDEKGRVTMIDLGKAKRIRRERTNTLCGTTHAIPPQVLLGNKFEYSYEFDYYSFGVLTYQLLIGNSPFGYANSNKNIREKIEQGLSKQKLEDLRKIDSDGAQLVALLMKVQNPLERLGCKGGFEQILQHSFWKSQKSAIKSRQIELIFNGKLQLSQQNEGQFDCYKQLSEIRDFGIENSKYQQISPDDPFFKFS